VSERLFRFLPGPVRAFTVKEIKTFLRDQAQWTQLFLIAALLVIYIYNFDALPLEKSPIQTVYLQNLFSFLNMGLALFVLTAVAARFAYPAVSLEREAFWLVKTSPLSLRAFLLIKFFIYYLPLLVLAEILIVGTNLLLKVTPFMMTLSTVTVFFLVPGIVAIGIGLGAAYPDFKAENPTQTVTSFGGLVFMITCAAYIGLVILLQAGPVYRIFMADLHGRPLSAAVWLWTAAAFSAALVLSILAVVLPLRFGLRRLSRVPI
jgi:ABC-2 type transport system permease protein